MNFLYVRLELLTVFQILINVIITASSIASNIASDEAFKTLDWTEPMMHSIVVSSYLLY